MNIWHSDASVLNPEFPLLPFQSPMQAVVDDITAKRKSKARHGSKLLWQRQHGTSYIVLVFILLPMD